MLYKKNCGKVEASSEMFRAEIKGEGQGRVPGDKCEKIGMGITSVDCV